jgi:hypothetical protein
MKKNFLFAGLLVLSLFVPSFSANEFDLRTNMLKLNSELNNLQRAFMTNNEEAVEVSLDRLADDAQDLLGSKEKMLGALPKDMKKRKHKVNVALKSAREIATNVKIIKQALLDNSKISPLKRQVKAQKAYTNIVHACFKCHNLVRDKTRQVK